MGCFDCVGSSTQYEDAGDLEVAIAQEMAKKDNNDFHKFAKKHSEDIGVKYPEKVGKQKEGQRLVDTLDANELKEYYKHMRRKQLSKYIKKGQRRPNRPTANIPPNPSEATVQVTKQGATFDQSLDKYDKETVKRKGNDKRNASTNTNNIQPTQKQSLGSHENVYLEENKELREKQEQLEHALQEYAERLKSSEVNEKTVEEYKSKFEELEISSKSEINNLNSKIQQLQQAVNGMQTKEDDKLQKKELDPNVQKELTAMQTKLQELEIQKNRELQKLKEEEEAKREEFQQQADSLKKSRERLDELLALTKSEKEVIKNKYYEETNEKKTKIKILEDQINTMEKELEEMRKPKRRVVTISTHKGTGDFLESDGFFMAQVKDNLEKKEVDLKEVSWDDAVEDQSTGRKKILVVFCINTSRLGTDVDATAKKIKITEKTKTLLVIFHHKPSHNSKVQPSKGVLSKDTLDKARAKTVVDCVYWNKEGFYDCETNQTAIKTITEKLDDLAR